MSTFLIERKLNLLPSPFKINRFFIFLTSTFQYFYQQPAIRIENEFLVSLFYHLEQINSLQQKEQNKISMVGSIFYLSNT
jgi:hypothetical protein